jgi:chromosomal replication initiation ATPase DnaA
MARTHERDIEIGVVAYRIMQDIARVTGLSRARIQQPTRRPPECAARFALWWLTREVTGASFPELAAIHGYHHTTILNGVSKAMDPGSQSRVIVLEVLRLYGSSDREAAAPG